MNVWQTVGFVFLCILCVGIGAVVGGLYTLWRAEQGRSASAVAAVRLLFYGQDGVTPQAVKTVATVPAPPTLVGQAPKVDLPFAIDDPAETQDPLPAGLDREHVIAQLMERERITREEAEPIADSMIASALGQEGSNV